MGDICRAIEGRISHLEILLAEYLTPLLRKQINHMIELHREALCHPDPYIDDLDALYDQFKEHWTKVYGDPISRACLLQDIIMFHRFLIAKLLEDYTNKPYTINKWVLDQAKCIIEQDGSSVSTEYPVHVIYPLEEMMLSRDYVENKLRVVALEQRRLGGDIQSLIDRCDWSNLATALTNDRDLALKLVVEQPFNTNMFDGNPYERILKGIDEIKGKYFTKLSDPSKFVISPHARKISAGQVSNHTNHGSSQTPQTIAPSNTRHHPGGPSLRSGFTWNIFNAFGLGSEKSSLKSEPSPPSSNDDWDKATFHINSKKAE